MNAGWGRLDAIFVRFWHHHHDHHRRRRRRHKKPREMLELLVLMNAGSPDNLRSGDAAPERMILVPGLPGRRRSGPSWSVLKPSWGGLEPSWSHLGTVLGLSSALMGRFGASRCYLEPSWMRLGAVLEPSWDDFGTVLGPEGPFWGVLVPS